MQHLYQVSVRLATILFHTFFSPNLTFDALCFSNTSQILTLIVDFHHLVICHIQDTKNKFLPFFSNWKKQLSTLKLKMPVINIISGLPRRLFLIPWRGSARFLLKLANMLWTCDKCLRTSIEAATINRNLFLDWKQIVDMAFSLN